MDSISYINLGKGNHPIDAVTINGLTLTSQEKSTWNSKQDALTFDSIPTVNSDNIVKSGDLYDVFYENEEVTSAALNDLNDRLLNIEGKQIITTSDEIIQGWINQEPKTLDLDKRYNYFAFNIYESCILKINTYYKGDQEYPKLSTVTHYVVVDINPSTAQYSISAAYMFGGGGTNGNNGYSVFEPYPYMNGNTQYYPIRLCASSDNTTFRLEFRTRIDSGDTSPKRVVEVSILKGSTSYLENYTNISTTYPQKCSAAWTMVKDSVSGVEYDSTTHELLSRDSLGISSVITSASTIVADGGGYIKPSTGIPASHIASGVIPTESTVSGWGFTKNAAPGKLTTTSTTALSTATNEALSGNISLHKIAKTGTYSDLVGKPDLPVACYFNPANETMYFFKSTADRDSFIANKTQTSLAMFSSQMSPYIQFKDPKVLEVLLSNNIGDGVGVTRADAAAVTSLGTMFNSNTEITSFNELDYFTGLTVLGNSNPGTFNGCTSLRSVTMPNIKLTSQNNTQIFERAFQNCTTLDTVTIYGVVSNYAGTSGPSYTFNGCTNLTRVNIDCIEDYLKNYWGSNSCDPFNASGGGRIYIDGVEVTNVVVPSTITKINPRAFRKCVGIESVTIPSSVTSIDQLAFNNCINLKTVTLSDGLTSIGSECFTNCSKISSITLPNTLTSIGSAAFQGCTSIATPTIPASLTTIGGNAFRNCTGMTGTLTIPSTVTSIGANAFNNCSNLSNLIIESTAQISTNTITDAAKNGTVHVYGSVKATNGYQYLTSRHIIIDGDYTGYNTPDVTVDTVESVRIGGNYYRTSSQLTNYNANSKLCFVEIMGTATGSVIMNTGYVWKNQSGGIIHLGYNGIACTPTQVNAANTAIAYVYVGPGISAQGDAAILDQYLADSAWSSYSSKLRTWYSYSGPYKTS